MSAKDGAADSALVAELKRLRAMPGNCDEANALIDAAISVQITAESNVWAGVCSGCGGSGCDDCKWTGQEVKP